MTLIGNDSEERSLLVGEGTAQIAYIDIRTVSMGGPLMRRNIMPILRRRCCGKGAIKAGHHS